MSSQGSASLEDLPVEVAAALDGLGLGLRDWLSLSCVSRGVKALVDARLHHAGTEPIAADVTLVAARHVPRALALMGRRVPGRIKTLRAVAPRLTDLASQLAPCLGSELITLELRDCALGGGGRRGAAPAADELGALHLGAACPRLLFLNLAGERRTIRAVGSIVQHPAGMWALCSCYRQLQPQPHSS